MFYLGVDIGGTTIKAALVDETGHVTEPRRIPTETVDWSVFLSNLIALIRGYQGGAPIEAIGIGVPGFRNSFTRRVVMSPNIPCLTNASLEKDVADEVQIPVVTENDANAGAYGEFVCGAGSGFQHMVYITLGTGCGSGVILNGRLFGGTSGYAAELGHTIVDPEGRPCPCGSRGCLETLVAAHGIVLTALELMKERRSVLEGSEDRLTSELIFDAATEGDSVAKLTFQRTGYWLGIACINLINLLNPQLIVISGGVMAAGDLLMKPLLDTVNRRAISAPLKDCRIVQSKLWPEAGIIGAAMVARDRHV